ncbi:flippase [Affinibrenneria salicis]|uniref:Flippase n=1 Tax=Affinibrenneria salicis TaxID=2590031 RepID=A0A5J5FTR6_9GAMM|nr:flippase [Affinibrenneria salicis]KAA8996985.1 flippase [Affinibrenneria salicis]
MKAMLVNSLWLMLERISLSLSGIFVSVYVARYLGPAQYGLINYLLSVIAIGVPLVQLGADTVLFNRVARRRRSGARLMLASMRIRRQLFALIAVPLLAWTLLTQDRTSQIMMALMLVSAWFSVQDVYKIYYDALLKSKLNTLINNLALLLAILLRLALVRAELSLAWFAVPYVLSSMIPWLVRVCLFRRERRTLAPISLRHQRRYSRYLLRVGLPLAVSSLSIVIYTRIDQIMLGNVLGEHSVGLYSAAITLSQGWVFVPIALITSMMPGVARARSPAGQEARIRLLYLVVLLLSLPVILLLSLCAGPIVILMFGEHYRAAAGILALCSVTSLFSVLGTISYRAIVLFGGYRFIAIKMPLAALVNVLLNVLLIPRYGITGAAVSTLITEFISFFVLNGFFRGGQITRLQLTCYRCLPGLIGRVREVNVK